MKERKPQASSTDLGQVERVSVVGSYRKIQPYFCLAPICLMVLGHQEGENGMDMHPMCNPSQRRCTCVYTHTHAGSHTRSHGPILICLYILLGERLMFIFKNLLSMTLSPYIPDLKLIWSVGSWTHL